MLESLTASGYYLLRIVPIIVASIIFAELLVKMGLLVKISFLTFPISRFSHLGAESSSAVLAAFLSPTAASAMLCDYYSQKLISRRELIIASLSRALPIIIMEARYMLPTVLPILGIVGLYYYGTWMGINFVMTLIVCLLGLFLLPQRQLGDMKVAGDPLPFRTALKESLKDSRKTLRRVLLILVPSTIGAFILAGIGVFDALGDNLGGFSQHLPIPSQGLPVLAAYIASPVASYPIAGTLLAQGTLQARDVIILFLLGSIFALPLHLRTLVPNYLGIYGPRPGLELLGYSFGLRSLITVAAIMALIIL